MLHAANPTHGAGRDPVQVAIGAVVLVSRTKVASCYVLCRLHSLNTAKPVAGRPFARLIVEPRINRQCDPSIRTESAGLPERIVEPAGAVAQGRARHAELRAAVSTPASG